MESRSSIIALLVVAGWSGLLCALAWLQQGFPAAASCATSMAMPIGLLWLGALGGAVWCWVQKRKLGAFGWFTLFFICGVVGNQFISQWAIRFVEFPISNEIHPALERRDLQTPFDAVVALGGATGEVLPGFSELTSDGERVLSAAQAFWSGKTRTIIVTGGVNQVAPEGAEQAREILVSIGVPDERIFSIAGYNTSQEMASLKAFLASPPQPFIDLLETHQSDFPPKSLRLGLITSAFHIPRAMRLAAKQGIALEPLPCAFRGSSTHQLWRPGDLIPHADHLQVLGLALKESLARVVGQ